MNGNTRSALCQRLSPLGIACLLACGDGTGPSMDACPSDTNFEVTTNLGAPVFSWAGDCGINALYVLTPDMADSDWAVEARRRNQLRSPIHYGQIPAGASELQRPGGSPGAAMFSIQYGPSETSRIAILVRF